MREPARKMSGSCQLMIVAMFAKVMPTRHDDERFFDPRRIEKGADARVCNDKSRICDEPVECLWRQVPMVLETGLCLNGVRRLHDHPLICRARNPRHRIDEAGKPQLCSGGNENHTTAPRKLGPETVASCVHWVSQ